MSSPEPRTPAGRSRRSRAVRVLGSVVYSLAVLVISLVLVVGLVLLLESRDQSEVEGEGGARAAPYRTDAYAGSVRSRRPNTTIRCAALYRGWQAVSTSRS